jgi:hypothetical protein
VAQEPRGRYFLLDTPPHRLVESGSIQNRRTRGDREGGDTMAKKKAAKKKKK